MTIGRNDPCPCGSGKKYKKCCAARGEPAPAGLKAAIRMKGGVAFDPVANTYHAIVYSWDNAECTGKPQEWQSAETFPSEAAAMNFYKANIRPDLKRLMDEASLETKNGVFLHRQLE